MESHEEMISKITLSNFKETPKEIKRIAIGICNEVYLVKLSEKEIIVRLSMEDYFLKGSHCHIPMFRKLGISVPEILAEDYSKIEIPYAYQFLSKIAGKDIGDVIADLSDEQLKNIAVEVSNIFDKTRTIPSSEKFGLVWGDFTEFSDTWTERMKIWIEETIERGKKTGIINDDLQAILKNLLAENKDYFDKVRPITYLGDISSKNVMINDGVFAGVVDLDGLTQGDPLEAIGRIEASWFGTHYGDFYTEEIMKMQKLDLNPRKIVMVYALINRISWACENGIQFNENTKAVVDKEKEKNDKKIIMALHEKLETM